MEKENLFSEKKKISFYSICFNILLFFVKLITGFLSNSKALVADAIHSLSDLISAITVYFGIKFSNYKSEKFPYGLYKLENLVSLISAFAIIFAGYEILKGVLLEKSSWNIEKPILAIFGVLFSIFATYLFYRWEKKQAIKLNSPSLLADAEHIKTDMLTSVVVLVGILGSMFGQPWIEKIATIIIVLFIFHAAYEIITSAIKVLLDANISKDTRKKIEKLSKKYHQISIKEIIGRQSGSFIFLEITLRVKEKDIEKAHEIVHKFEKDIKNNLPFVERVIIHMEPFELKEKDNIKIAFLVKEIKDKNNIVLASNLCETKHVIAVDYDKVKGTISNIKCYKSSCFYTARPKAFCLIDFLEKLNVDIFVLSSLEFSKSFLDVLNIMSLKVCMYDKGYISLSNLRKIINIILDSLKEQKKPSINKIDLKSLEINCQKFYENLA